MKIYEHKSVLFPFSFPCSRRWQRLAFAGGDKEEEATSMMTYGGCGGGVCEGIEATTTDPA